MTSTGKACNSSRRMIYVASARKKMQSLANMNGNQVSPKRSVPWPRELQALELKATHGKRQNTRKEKMCVSSWGKMAGKYTTHTTQRTRQGDSNLYDTTERQKNAQLILIWFYGAYRAKRIWNTLFPQIAWNSLWLIMLLDPAMCPRFSEVFICLKSWVCSRNNLHISTVHWDWFSSNSNDLFKNTASFQFPEQVGLKLQDLYLSVWFFCVCWYSTYCQTDKRIYLICASSLKL